MRYSSNPTVGIVSGNKIAKQGAIRFFNNFSIQIPSRDIVNVVTCIAKAGAFPFIDTPDVEASMTVHNAVRGRPAERSYTVQITDGLLQANARNATKIILVIGADGIATN